MSTSRLRCSAVNSIGLHCGHYAVLGLEKCQFHATRAEKAKADAFRQAMWRGNPDGIDVLDKDPTEFGPDDLKDAPSFARAVLTSAEFQDYVMMGIRKRDIPPTVLLRLMDYADGWGKPSDKIEHSGKDGQPVVTEIRRTIIHPQEEPSTEVTLEVSDDQLDIPLPVVPDSIKRMH